MPVRGATWQSESWHLEGLCVSGPWLGVWGSNAIALRRPLLYTQFFRPLSPCGTMFPRIFFCTRRGRTVGVGFNRDDGDASIAWTQVHAITIKTRVRKVL